MTKREFLERLERCLASMDATERSSMVEFYEEQIDDRMDDGMAEEAAVSSLESPEDIAANILTMRAEAARTQANAARAAADSATTVMTGSTPTASSPRQKRSFLRGLGRSLLGFLEVLAAIILVPVAIGLAAAIIGTYAALWGCAIALAGVSLGFAAVAVVFVISLFMAAPATAAVGVGTAGLIVGALGLTVLFAILAYAFGKLLVYLVIWCVRPIRRSLARRRAQREVTTKQYPSMPVPPMPTAAPVAPQRSKFPLWGKFAIVATLLSLVGGGLVLGAVVSVGSMEALVREAGSNGPVRELTVDGSDVSAIDLSSQAFATNGQDTIGFSIGGGGNTDRQFVALGVSPDDRIHVRGSSQTWSMIFQHSDPYTLTQPTLDGDTVRLESQQVPGGLTVQNPFASLAYDGIVHVLVPQNWAGTITCDSDTTGVSRDSSHYLGNRYAATLTIDGALELRAGTIDLAYVSAASMELESVENGTGWGGIFLDTVSASGSITISGPNAMLRNVDAAGGLSIDPNTRILGPYEDGEYTHGYRSQTTPVLDDVTTRSIEAAKDEAGEGTGSTADNKSATSRTGSNDGDRTGSDAGGKAGSSSTAERTAGTSSNS